ncbi:MAG: hypothetical protein ACLUKN_12995 [Bacilli bacterium]
MRSKAAAEQRAWNSEKSILRSFLPERDVVHCWRKYPSGVEIAEANKQTEIIRRKLSKDESAMRDLDAFLSEKYEAWIGTPHSGCLVKNRPGRPPEVCRKKCFGKSSAYVLY